MTAEQPQKPRALAVDDDAGIRMLVMTLLQREGYQVDAASDGVEAVEALRRKSYDLVVLDLMMPRLDGKGVIESLVREKGENEIPRIVVMTAAGPTVIDELPKDHIDKIVTKPFELATLRSLVTLGS